MMLGLYAWKHDLNVVHTVSVINLRSIIVLVVYIFQLIIRLFQFYIQRDSVFSIIYFVEQNIGKAMPNM